MKIVADYVYTDQELLALYRQALAQISLGQTVGLPGGRSVSFVDIKAVIEMINLLEQRIATVHTGGGMARARYVR